MATDEQLGVVNKFDSLKVALSKQQKKIADMSLKIEQADARRVDLLQRLRKAELHRDKILRSSKQVDTLLHREANFLHESINSIRTTVSESQDERDSSLAMKVPQMINILECCLQHLHVLLHCSVLEPGKLEKDLAACGKADPFERKNEPIGSIPTLSPASSVMSLNSITPRTQATATPRTEIMMDMATIEDVPDVGTYFGQSDQDSGSHSQRFLLPHPSSNALDPITDITDNITDKHSESSHDDTNASNRQMSLPIDGEMLGFTVTAGLEFAHLHGPAVSDNFSRRALMPDTMSDVKESFMDQNNKRMLSLIHI